MKKAQVSVGKTYAVKVSDRIVPVTLTEESPYGGWNGRNEATGRTVRIRTAARLRFEAVRGESGKWRKA
jgi:hypothetical protein